MSTEPPEATTHIPRPRGVDGLVSPRAAKRESRTPSPTATDADAERSLHMHIKAEEANADWLLAADSPTWSSPEKPASPGHPGLTVKTGIPMLLSSPFKRPLSVIPSTGERTASESSNSASASSARSLLSPRARGGSITITPPQSPAARARNTKNVFAASDSSGVASPPQSPSSRSVKNMFAASDSEDSLGTPLPAASRPKRTRRHAQSLIPVRKSTTGTTGNIFGGLMPPTALKALDSPTRKRSQSVQLDPGMFSRGRLQFEQARPTPRSGELTHSGSHKNILRSGQGPELSPHPESAPPRHHRRATTSISRSSDHLVVSDERSNRGSLPLSRRSASSHALDRRPRSTPPTGSMASAEECARLRARVLQLENEAKAHKGELSLQKIELEEKASRALKEVEAFHEEAEVRAQQEHMLKLSHVTAKLRDAEFSIKCLEDQVASLKLEHKRALENARLEDAETLRTALENQARMHKIELSEAHDALERVSASREEHFEALRAEHSARFDRVVGGLQEDVAQYKAESERLTETLEEVERERDNALAKIERDAEFVASARAERERMMAQWDDELARIRDELSSRHERNVQLMNDNYMKAITASKQREMEARRERDDAQRELSVLQYDHRLLEQRHQQTNLEYTRVAKESRQLHRRAEAADRLEQRNQQLEAKLAQLEKRIKPVEQALSNNTTLLERVAVDRDELVRKLAESEELCKRLTKRQEHMRAELEQKRAEVLALTRDLTHMNNTVTIARLSANAAAQGHSRAKASPPRASRGRRRTKHRS